MANFGYFKSKIAYICNIINMTGKKKKMPQKMSLLLSKEADRERERVYKAI